MTAAPGNLGDLGWPPSLEAAFAPYGRRGLVRGRVALEHNHVYRVLTAPDAPEQLAEASGRLKHRAGGRHELPAVGDWVALRLGRPGTRAVIEAILPRHSQFQRKAAGRETEVQVVAANIDLTLLVFGLDGALKPRSIERYLVTARRSGARPVILLNKADLVADAGEAVREVSAVAGAAPVLPVSAKLPGGLLAVRSLFVRGQTVALLGPSGAGKSSIVNALSDRDVVPTGEVRDYDLRGRHTSVHRELIVLPGGVCLIDTPGLRELQLWEPDEGLGETFDEIADAAAGCRFRDCRHDQEPGCAVKRAVEAGTVSATRYAHYLKLQHEQEALARRVDERAHMEARRQTKIVHRAMRRMQRDRER